MTDATVQIEKSKMAPKDTKDNQMFTKSNNFFVELTYMFIIHLSIQKSWQIGHLRRGVKVLFRDP